MDVYSASILAGWCLGRYVECRVAAEKALKAPAHFSTPGGAVTVMPVAFQRISKEWSRMSQSAKEPLKKGKTRKESGGEEVLGRRVERRVACARSSESTRKKRWACLKGNGMCVRIGSCLLPTLGEFSSIRNP